jgi:RNA polymerase sigma-70 factor (ECF subfamily)
VFFPIHHLWFATDCGNADEANPAFLSLFAGTESGTGRRRGDEIVRMYDALRPSLLGYLVGLGLLREEAEDVVQETFLRLLRSIEEVQDEEHLRPWIFRVAHNLTVDQFRSGRYRADANSVELSTLHEVLSYPGLSPEESAIKQEQWRIARQAIERLTPQQKYVVLLRAEGLRYREIGEVLNLSTTRVGEIVQRALVRLAGGE